MPRVGIKGQSYLNKGTRTAPQWKRACGLRDLTLEMTKAEVQVKNKGSMFVEYLTGLIDTPLDCECDWEPGDPVFDAMQEAYFTEEPLEFVILDGGIRKVGAQGLRANFIVTKFGRGEPMEDVMSASVSLRLSAESKDKPQWVKVKANGIEVIGEFGEDLDNEPEEPK